MKWWIRRNGRTEGPYSEEDIRKRITLNMVGSLDRVSIDRQRWQYLKDTELWRPQNKKSAVTSPIRLEHSTPVSPLSALRSIPGASSMPTGEPFVSIPERLQLPTGIPPPSHPNRRLILLVCGGAATVLAIMLIAMTVLLSSRSSVKEAAGNMTSTEEFEAVREAVALIKSKEASGTGFLLHMGGKTYLMSNEHVVRSGGKIEARLIDGTLLRLGEFSVADDGRDLARFEVLDCDKKPLQLRETMPSIGEQVTVYGNSLGGGVATESKGFIQGVGPKRIETNAEIVSGNSGSPLMDVKGAVIGVAALMDAKHLVDEEDRFFNRDTRYADHVRRFAVRLSDVTWKILPRNEYETQVRSLKEFATYWEHLLPFLLFDSCKVNKSKLVYNDFYGKDFNMSDTGFDDMLKSVAMAYERNEKMLLRLNERIDGRDNFRQRLNLAIEANEISKDEAKKVSAEYDEKIKTAYEKRKESLRKMILIRKEALSHAQTFLGGRAWDAPQVAHGYDDDPGGSVDKYREFIKNALDLMNQKMKDLNKDIKEFEKGDDDDEND